MIKKISFTSGRRYILLLLVTLTAFGYLYYLFYSGFDKPAQEGVEKKSIEPEMQ